MKSEKKKTAGQTLKTRRKKKGDMTFQEQQV